MDQNPNNVDLLKAKILQKCINDPIFFISNFCYIETTTDSKSGIYEFSPYEYQTQFIETVINSQFVIVVKGRQLGFSTVISAFATWLLLFNEAYKIVVISKDSESAAEIISRIKLIVERLPSFLRPAKLLNNNVKSLRLSNRSHIRSISTTKKSGRSYSPNLLILDEGAFIDQLDGILTASVPALSRTGGKCVIISTPNGPSGTYYDIYQNAVLGKNEYTHVNTPWWENPDYMVDAIQDPEFPGGIRSSWAEREFRRLDNDPIKFLQEYCCAFNVADNQFFPTDTLERARNEQLLEPLNISNYNLWADFESEFGGHRKNFWVFKNPIPGGEYIISADIGRGDGKDFSTFHVIDKVAYEQVAEYQGKIDTTEFANLLIYTGKKYNMALLIPENNSVGWSTVNDIVNQEYTNLFFTPRNLNDLFKMNYVYNEQDTKNIAGWSTTSKTRPLILNQLREDMIAQDIIVRSKRLLFELENFIWNEKGKPEAKAGKHDDLVMSFAIGCFVRSIFLIQQGMSSDNMIYYLNNFQKNVETIDFSVQGSNNQIEELKQKKFIQDFGWVMK